MAFTESSSNKVNEYFSRLEVDGEDGSEFIDHWDTGELLFLASSVQRSDRNWVSVARGLKLYGEQTRPADFYTPKNCALQYTKLLSEVDEDSKKKTLPRTERETSEAMLVKNLTDKRLTELAWLNQQTKVAANILKTYADMVENGDFDDQLDDLVKNIEEKEKREEEKYVEYLSKRESLNATKKLNKSRLAKGKTIKTMDSKKKSSSFSEISDDSPSKTSVAEVVKNIKKEIEEELAADSTKHMKKSELDTNISLNALLDSKITMPASVSPTSPLLTSLLRTITSTSSVSPSLPPLSCSPLKESELNEGDHIGIFSKSKETSPRGAVPQSPRPTPSSSPLLNSLLKNSPSSSTIASKDISPKAVSSPQPFFNPSNVLASATAQQLAVATSTQSLSHQFFPQEASDSRKASYQLSPITSSACLSAPTLSKLLEMPPSTPGRLPPLPVLDPPITPTTTGSFISIKASNQQQSQNEMKNLTEYSPIKRPSDLLSRKSSTQLIFETPADISSDKLQQNESFGDMKVKKVMPFEVKPLVTVKKETLNVIPKEEPMDSECPKMEIVKEEIADITLDLLEQESPEFFSVEIKQETQPEENALNIQSNKIELLTDIKEEIHSEIVKSTKPNVCKNLIETEEWTAIIPTIKTEKLDDSEAVMNSLKSKGVKQSLHKENDLALKTEEDPATLLATAQIKKEPETSPKKIIRLKTEPEIAIKSSLNIKTEGGKDEKNLDSNSGHENDSKSPVSKRAKIYDTTTPEKQLTSEDEMTSSVRRSGRKGKKTRGRSPKPSLSEFSEPKDHYEFTESADESSAGFPTSNMLRYGSRIKDASRPDDKTKSSKQEFEDLFHSTSTESPTLEKKISHLKSKSSCPLQTYSRGKSPFPGEEEVISESIISEDTSNSLLTEDKLKKWAESTENQKNSEMVSENIKFEHNAGKVNMEASKKNQSMKRPLSSSNNKNFHPNKKERKLTGSDFDELSACSRDSEDVEKESSDKKQKIANITESSNEAVDNPSSTAAESEAMDDMESLQSTDFSPLPAPELKEEKDSSQFGKQDWFQGVSPKSSEHVSQSSEESEYESDNWDNHSVSTNKSASHSSDPQPRTKRKERESAKYKAWKKAIHIVLREASCHKYANVFLQKVTNDVAPGYTSIVYRPMDLSLIKKNIDNGIIRTTEEFHRDMLLMFQNAIMYNSSDHDVYKMAVEMQGDVMQQIMSFLTTQYNDQDERNEPTSSLRGARTTKSQKGAGKQASTTFSTTKMKEESERE